MVTLFPLIIVIVLISGSRQGHFFSEPRKDKKFCFPPEKIPGKIVRQLISGAFPEILLTLAAS
jgi:hypothetical protein